MANNYIRQFETILSLNKTTEIISTFEHGSFAMLFFIEKEVSA